MDQDTYLAAPAVPENIGHPSYHPPLDRFSFPSGHTLHAVCFTLVACAHYPGLLLLLVPFTLLVAASRLILGLHWLSDVIAGAGIGGLMAWIFIQAASLAN